MWTISCFKSGFWNAFWNAEKRAFWIVIRLESLILGHVNAKLFRNVIRACAFLKMRAEAMHKRMGQSARADYAVGAKYYLAVRRSWSWLGRCLQCMWTHVVQITIPITFWIAIRNVFRNVILAYVNTASRWLLADRFSNIGRRNVTNCSNSTDINIPMTIPVFDGVCLLSGWRITRLLIDVCIMTSR